MKPIHLILSIALLAGGACGDQQEPYYGNSEVKMPQIDSEWNLELMPNRSGQYWKVFVYKDLKYNALFTRSLGWNGGDGVFTTGLPDGNIFWSFNDSFYGVINENRSRGNCSFPRNSIMVQTPGEKDENLVWLADYVQTNDPNADRYYQVRTHIRHPKATLSDEKIQAGEIDQDYLYWAGDATIYNNQMQMLWGAVDNTDPNNLMRRFGTCLATYSLEGKPGDATYMKLISRNDNFNDHTLGYGDTMWKTKTDISIFTQLPIIRWLWHVPLHATLAASGNIMWPIRKDISRGQRSTPQPKMLKILQLSLWKVHVLCLGYLKKVIPTT